MRLLVVVLGLWWCACLLAVCAGFSWLLVYFVAACGLVGLLTAGLA